LDAVDVSYIPNWDSTQVADPASQACFLQMS
jgi:hypothetical protein